jgi:hypothetical protein
VAVRNLAGNGGGAGARARAGARVLRARFSADSLLEPTREIQELAAAYVAQGVVSPKFQDDARHVAAATVHGVGLLVSWNFKHLVNVRREAGFNGVNLLKGYPAIRIVNPLELIYGPEDQSL